jgi:predicted nucleic acid-binding protein
VTACVLDTDVLIAALDRADAHHVAATRAFRVLAADEIPLLISAVNYAETLVRPAEDEATWNRVLGAIDALEVEVVPCTAGIAREAARVRTRGVSLPDGFAIATARARSASVASFDRRVRRTARALGVIVSP